MITGLRSERGSRGAYRNRTVFREILRVVTRLSRHPEWARTVARPTGGMVIFVNRLKFAARRGRVLSIVGRFNAI